MDGRWPARLLRSGARPRWRDAAAVVVLTGLAIGARDHLGGYTPFDLVLAAAGTLPLLVRRAFPVAVLMAVEVLLVVQVFLEGTQRTPGLAVALAIYTVARSRDRATSLRAALIVAPLNSACVLLAVLVGRSPTAADIVPHVILIAGSWGIGDNVRNRQAYLASLRDRAERAERDREENARRAVLEERTRIARELHDVVAHHVSAIAVTAGAAEEAAVAQPERARAALRSIQQTGREALSEMRALVGVLQPGGSPDAALGPQPGLDDVERLVAQSRAAGLEVTLAVEGPRRALPEALELTAYRIVQEALTNTMKHARASRAQVTVRFGDSSVELIVSDDGGGTGERPEAEDGGGRGLVGMRERVALFRGELSAGRERGGGYRVAARLPLSGLPG